MRRQIRFVIPAARAGGALLDFLAARFTYHTRDAWQDAVADGRVTVNNSRAVPGQTLNTGDELAYAPTTDIEPPVDERIAIVYDDADLLVINKSGNLPCHPGGRYFNHTLWALLKTRHGVDNPIFVNRLDRETSGLVVVARTPAAAKAVRAQFATRTVEKRYIALVEGRLASDRTVGGWIVPDYGGEVLKKRRFIPVSDTVGGTDAVGRPADCEPPAGAAPPCADATWASTAFRPLAMHGAVSRIEVRPLTGRLHQIRVTLQAMSLPVVGDKMYGVDPTAFVRFCQGALTDEDRARLRLDRQALHAAGLRFRHPRSGHVLSFDLPLPADMEAAAAGACA